MFHDIWDVYMYVVTYKICTHYNKNYLQNGKPLC